MNTSPALFALAIAVVSNGVLAQNTKIYRCGPDGRELSQMPCPEGQVLTPKSAAPDVERRRQAAEVAQREEKLGNQMAAERREREAAQARSAAGAAGMYGRSKAAAEPAAEASAPANGAASKRSKKLKAPRKPEGFTAISPKPVKQSKGNGETPAKP